MTKTNIASTMLCEYQTFSSQRRKMIIKKNNCIPKHSME